LRNKSMENLWGLRPHTFFTLILRNLGPQTPSGDNFGAILIFCVSHSTWGWTRTRVAGDTPIFLEWWGDPPLPKRKAQHIAHNIWPRAVVSAQPWKCFRTNQVQMSNITTLYYEIMHPGRKSGFRARFRPDSNHESLSGRPKDGRRADLRLSRLESGQNRSRKPDFWPGSTIA
jgi:hypothetical protein